MVEKYEQLKQQKIADLSSRILTLHTKEYYAHKNNAFREEKEFRKQREKLESELVQVKGIVVEIEDVETVKFNG